MIEEARGAGWAIGLATGNTGPLDEYLSHIDLTDAFDAIVRTHGSTFRPKPAPDVFLELAAQLKVEPERCVVLEDSVPGAEAGIAAGMLVVVCPSLATKVCTFPDGAFRRVDTLAEFTLSELMSLGESP